MLYLAMTFPETESKKYLLKILCFFYSNIGKIVNHRIITLCIGVLVGHLDSGEHNMKGYQSKKYQWGK